MPGVVTVMFTHTVQVVICNHVGWGNVIFVSRENLILILMINTGRRHTHTMNNSHVSFFVIKNRVQLVPKFPKSLQHNMPSKQEWINKLEKAGARVPKSWTILQMQALWDDLQEENKGNNVTSMDSKIKDLKSAARKKDILVAYVTQEGGQVTNKMTIPQIFKVGEQVIMEKFEPQDTEPVGFGMHGDKTYEEIYREKPGYIKWVMDTAKGEPESHWRLKRLARWATRQQHEETLGYQMPIVGGYKKDNIPKAKAKAASTGSFSMVAAEDFGMEDQSVSSQEMLEKDLEIARLRNMLSQMEKEKDEQQLILSRSKNRKEM